jgi:hypothetical protein
MFFRQTNKRSNVLTPWISHQIVSSKSLKIRAELLTKCVQTMTYLEVLNLNLFLVLVLFRMEALFFYFINVMHFLVLF